MSSNSCKRASARLRVECPAYYSDGKFHASGTVQNLSEAGGLMKGTHAVQAGMDLVVLIIPPAPRTALLIRRATVKWVDGQTFGLELAELEPFAQAELARLAVAQIPGLWASLN